MKTSARKCLFCHISKPSRWCRKAFSRTRALAARTPKLESLLCSVLTSYLFLSLLLPFLWPIGRKHNCWEALILLYKNTVGKGYSRLRMNLYSTFALCIFLFGKNAADGFPHNYSSVYLVHRTRYSCKNAREWLKMPHMTCLYIVDRA